MQEFNTAFRQRMAQWEESEAQEGEGRHEEVGLNRIFRSEGI